MYQAHSRFDTLWPLHLRLPFSSFSLFKKVNYVIAASHEKEICSARTVKSSLSVHCRPSYYCSSLEGLENVRGKESSIAR